MAARYEEVRYVRNIFTYFLVPEEKSTDDVRVAKSTVLWEIRPGAGFKSGDFVNLKMRGVTVERLECVDKLAYVCTIRI